MLYNDDNRPRFISLKVIIDRVMSRPGMEDLPYDVAILATVDCVQLIGNPLFLAPNDCYVNISNYRGELQDDIVDIKKVVRLYSDDAENRIPMTTNSDPFFTSYSGRGINQSIMNSVKYRVQGEYIYTSFESGKLHVAYEGIPVDTDGIPMIPDRASILKAIEYSIIKEWFERKMFAGRIGADKFQYADKERNWYISKASTDFMLENLDKRKALSNILNTLFTNEEHSTNDYVNLGNKEYRRRHI